MFFQLKSCTKKGYFSGLLSYCAHTSVQVMFFFNEISQHFESIFLTLLLININKYFFYFFCQWTWFYLYNDSGDISLIFFVVFVTNISFFFNLCNKFMHNLMFAMMMVCEWCVCRWILFYFKK